MSLLTSKGPKRFCTSQPPHWLLEVNTKTPDPSTNIFKPYVFSLNSCCCWTPSFNLRKCMQQDHRVFHWLSISHNGPVVGAGHFCPRARGLFGFAGHLFFSIVRLALHGSLDRFGTVHGIAHTWFTGTRPRARNECDEIHFWVSWLGFCRRSIWGGEDSHGNSFFTVLSLQDGNCPVFVFGMTENAIQMFLSSGVMSGVCSQDILEFCLIALSGCE